ncbi:MAG TPA: zinc ribbon domain-containing protein [Pyrinomonadaceae bacterium]|nr:zinc ribbon domain-containing protein [Pyrinomonadaceae bacterium]
MFCPNCASQNIDNAKFCRACGLELESVALAMHNKLAPPSNWLELYGESKSKVAVGAIMAGAALLIWVVPAFMIRDTMAWVAIWSIFFGWLAVWGIIKFALNVGDLIRAKTMLKSQYLYNAELPPGEQYGLPPKPAGQQTPTPRYATDQLQSPPSVTEHTTRFLDRK